MMSFFNKLKALGHRKSENAKQNLVENPPSAFYDIESSHRFSRLPQTAHAVERKGRLKEYTRTLAYNNHVERAGLQNMVFHVEVWRETNLGLSENQKEGYELTATRFLRPGSKGELNLFSSYSFETFMEVFERKINQRNPEYPIDMYYGRVVYFPLDIDSSSQSGYDPLPREIRDQDEFEVAFNHLYLGRSTNPILLVVFQPEKESERFERTGIEHPLVIQMVFGAPSSVTSPKAQQGAFITDHDGPRRILETTEKDTAKPVDDQPAENSMQSPKHPARLTGSPLVIPSPLGSPIVQTPNRIPARDLSSMPMPDAPDRAIDTHLVSPTKSGLSGNEEHNEAFTPPASSVGGSVRIAANPPVRVRRQLETPDELVGKYKDLYEQASVVVYKKGGPEEEFEEDMSKLKITPEEDDEESDEKEEEEEEEEDEDVSQESRVVKQLQAMTKMTGLDQLREDPHNPGDSMLRWKQCCAMFGIEKDKTGPEDLVNIAGLKTKIYQYQAFGIYWQMVTSRKFGGGFLADDMGLGKTLSFLSYMVVERQLSVLWLEVDKSRREKDSDHLKLAQTPEEIKAASVKGCPSRRNTGWIACPCDPSSPTSKMARKPGLRMACVPVGLVGSWWTQWKTHVDTSNTALALTIMVDHPGAFDNRTSLPDMNSQASTARNISRSEATKYKPNAASRQSGEGDDIAKPYQDGMLLLTTQEQCEKWIKRFEYKGPTRDATKPGIWKKIGTRSNLVFGIAMIDESHEQYLKGTGRAGVLLHLPSAHQPFLWGYSGTPLSQSPRGLEGVLWAIEKHAPVTEEKKTGWQSDPALLPFEWGRLDRLCKQYDGLVKSEKRNDAAVEEILKRFKPFMLTFMIRRDAASSWFGHPLVKLQPHVHRDVTLKQNNPKFSRQQISKFEDEFQEEKENLLLELQEKWDKFPDLRRSDHRPTKLAFNTQCRKEWRSRLLGTFPYLRSLASEEVEENSRMDLTSEETARLWGSPNKENDNGYARLLKYIVEDSPKAMWLYKFIYELEDQKDLDGNEQKVIILTNFPQVAFILKLFIERYFPAKKGHVGVIAKKMKLKEKIEIQNAFTDAMDAKRNRLSRNDFSILIGTSRLVGLGLQLTRSCNLVLMEPDIDFVNERQGHGRVHRIGQKNPVSYSYRLIDEASEVEERILKRQAERKEFAGESISEDEVERLEMSAV